MIYRSHQELHYPEHADLTNILFDYNLQGTPSNKPAVIDGPTGDVVFTYESIRDAVRRVAGHLQTELKIQPGTVVGILSTNRHYFPVCVHAILAVGGVVSALNPAYQPQELAHALSLSKPRHVLVEKDLLSTLNSALKSIPNTGPHLHVWDDDSPNPSLASTLPIESIIRHASPTTFTRPTSLPPPARRVAFICFSSGTSGLVKGVRLSHSNIISNIHQQRAALTGMFAPNTVLALIVPFFHILGLAGFCCQFIAFGAPIVMFRRFEFGPLLAAIKRDRITHINVVPPIALEFLRNPIADHGDYSSVRALCNAAAPLKGSIAERIERKLGCVVTQWYGMTECSPSVSSQREDEVGVKGTIGKLLPGMEMRIVDEEGKDARVGELLLRGPNVMLGYVQHGSVQSNAMTKDGFLKTGDVGYIDENGFIFLVDRAKEMIKVKGNQVAPAELEAVLLSHPAVEDAAVCGVYDDERATEYPIAYIATKITGHQELEGLKAEVRQFVDGQVTRYKQLKGGVHVLDAIPRNASGKILRRLLPANLAAAEQAKRAVKPSDTTRGEVVIQAKL